MSDLIPPPAGVGNVPLPLEELQRTLGAYVLEAVALRHELAVVAHERDLLRFAADRRPLAEPAEHATTDAAAAIDHQEQTAGGEEDDRAVEVQP